VFESYKKILGILNKCNDLSNSYAQDGKVENAGDFVMDAQILKMSHDLFGTTSDRMGSCDFSDDLFVNEILALISKDGGFDRLHETASASCKTSHFSLSLYGTCDIKAPPPPEKAKKERQKGSKEVAKVKAPENVKQLSKRDQGAEKINAVYEEILKICKQRGKKFIPYYELICNPESFMKSVDIAFQVAFLVRDGNLGLKTIGGELHVTLAKDQHSAPKKGNHHDTKQCVLSLNHNLWQSKVQQFKLKKPLIKVEREVYEDPQMMETDSE